MRDPRIKDHVKIIHVHHVHHVVPRDPRAKDHVKLIHVHVGCLFYVIHVPRTT